jgi:DNA polymerase III delta subunit
VFVEPKPDKRTKTYKLLKEGAGVQEFAVWKEGDVRTAEAWVTAEVTSRDMTLDSSAIRALVDWVGAEQWELHYALEKLAVLDTVTPEVIREVIDATPSDNVFHVFETALRGDRSTLRRVLSTLEHSEDGYRLFGLLANQAYQLAAVAVSDKPASEVARALGVHPYALSKLQSHADRLGRAGARRVIHRLAEADHRLKTGNDDIWVVLEAALAGIAE